MHDFKAVWKKTAEWIKKLTGDVDLKNKGDLQTQADTLADRLDGEINKVLDTPEAVSANTAEGNIAGALAVKAIKADLTNQIGQINSDLTVNEINDSDKTILDIIKQIAPQTVFSFWRSVPTSDAPIYEGWSYTYIIIPVEWDLYMVQAYRAYTPNAIYQRFAHITNGWSDSWFEFYGNRIT